MAGPQPADATHRCPAPECAGRVPQEQFACRQHWYLLPASIRSAIWRGYRSEPLGVFHTQAMLDATRWYEENLTGK